MYESDLNFNKEIEDFNDIGEQLIETGCVLTASGIVESIDLVRNMFQVRLDSGDTIVPVTFKSDKEEELLESLYVGWPIELLGTLVNDPLLGLVVFAVKCTAYKPSEEMNNGLGVIN